MSLMQHQRTCECGCDEIPAIAKTTSKRDGTVRGEQLRFVHGHNRKKRLDDRYVVEDQGYITPCWIWLGEKNGEGYGRIRRRTRSYSAHRILYEMHVGSIPYGLVLDHLCRIPRCVNPAHLEPVTQAENVRRGIGVGAQGAVTDAMVNRMRELDTAGVARGLIAAEFGVHRTTVNRHLGCRAGYERRPTGGTPK
jgi:hypothetical protein